MPSNVHSVGLYIRRYAKIIIFGGIYIFHSITCFKNFLMAGTRIHVFSYVGIPDCFLTVLSCCYLILFGIAIFNYLQFPFLSLSIRSSYVTFGQVCFLLMLIEWSREVGVFCLELLSALLFFIVLLNCPFSFLYSVRLCLQISMFGSLKNRKPKNNKTCMFENHIICFFVNV